MFLVWWFTLTVCRLGLNVKVKVQLKAVLNLSDSCLVTGWDQCVHAVKPVKTVPIIPTEILFLWKKENQGRNWLTELLLDSGYLNGAVCMSVFSIWMIVHSDTWYGEYCTVL